MWDEDVLLECVSAGVVNVPLMFFSQNNMKGHFPSDIDYFSAN